MLFSRVLRFSPVESVETFSVSSGAYGVDWNSAFRAVWSCPGRRRPCQVCRDSHVDRIRVGNGSGVSHCY